MSDAPMNELKIVAPAPTPTLEEMIEQKCMIVYEQVLNILRDRDVEYQDMQKDVHHAFLMVNNSITAVVSKLEVLENYVIEKLGVSKEEIQAKTIEVVTEKVQQQKAIMERLLSERAKEMEQTSESLPAPVEPQA